ncbi:MAG TPA: CDP-glycerol glycerophosphotransferase family protein [Candidatus Thermoplasmatota archaeon]|jgi:CDP-glycerol glycerophosphotransferase (TagB/SpsB family)|nr:CDP-glycerol glycerophosphotransferase family protein [Candidatus Thermoplasmatota archaeon]
MDLRSLSLLSVLRAPLWVLYWLSGFVPRDPNLWVFGSWDGVKYSDNPRYVFEYLHRQMTTMGSSKVPRVRWITSSREVKSTLKGLGFPVTERWSFRGMLDSIRAGVYVYCSTAHDINTWLSRGAYHVNLWHGIPLKKLGTYYPRDDGRSTSLIARVDLFGLRYGLRRPTPKVNSSIATTGEVARTYAEFFRIPVAHVPLTGFPRNDPLLQPRSDITQAEREFAHRVTKIRQEGTLVALYAPTFRDHETGSRSVPINWKKLSEELEEIDGYLFLRLHHVDSLTMPTELPPRIEVTPSTVDLPVILAHIDCLVTDYSSIYFDFILTGKPVIFYCYDLQEYVSRSRRFAYPYDEVAPGPHVTTQSDLVCELSKVRESNLVEWRASRTRVAETFHVHLDASSAQRVADHLLRLLIPRKASAFLENGGEN